MEAGPKAAVSTKETWGVLCHARFKIQSLKAWLKDSSGNMCTWMVLFNAVPICYCSKHWCVLLLHKMGSNGIWGTKCHLADNVLTGLCEQKKNHTCLFDGLIEFLTSLTLKKAKTEMYPSFSYVFNMTCAMQSHSQRKELEKEN